MGKEQQMKGKEATTTSLRQLEAFMAPASVAIVGASRAKTAMSHSILKNVVGGGYSGNVYPVNPKATDIEGLPCFPSVSEIPGAVDLAGIFLPRAHVEEAVRDCVRKGVRGVVIVSAGFSETGPSGRQAQAELLEAVRDTPTRLVGPNCNGLFNAKWRLNFTAIRDVPRVWGGGVSLVFQSGNLSIAAVEKGLRMDLRFNSFINVGNQADVGILEWIEYFATDPATKVICIYMEELKGGRRFLESASRAAAVKPVILLKAGGSEAGARAVSSHTGALAGDRRLLEACYRRAGIITVSCLEEMLDTALAAAECPPPLRSGTAILGDGGGHVSIASDLAERFGLSVPLFSSATQEKLASVLNPLAAKTNPIDLVNYEADLDLYYRACKVCAEDETTGSILMTGLFGGIWDPAKGRPPKEGSPSYAEVAEAIAGLVASHRKPLVVHSDYAGSSCEALQRLREFGIPVYPDLDRAVLSLSKLVSYHDHIVRRGVEPQPVAAPTGTEARAGIARAALRGAIKGKSGRQHVAAQELASVLEAYGIPAPPQLVATSPEAAVAAAGRIGFPVVLKVLSSDIVHKTDVGGVALSLKSEGEVSCAYARIVEAAVRGAPGAEVRGVTVMPHVSQGVEVIIGMLRNDQVGPVVMFGMGGILVEVLDDVAFSPAPVDEVQALELMARIRGYKLLAGVRGKQRCDLEALARIVVRVSELAIEIPEVLEVDLNPVLASPEGAVCLDARAMVCFGGC